MPGAGEALLLAAGWRGICSLTTHACSALHPYPCVAQVLAASGLLSVLSGQEEVFFFNVTNPEEPTLIAAADPPLNGCADEFRQAPGGGFLVGGRDGRMQAGREGGWLAGQRQRFACLWQRQRQPQRQRQRQGSAAAAAHTACAAAPSQPGRYPSYICHHAGLQATMMCAADGMSPGRVARFDGDLNLVGEQGSFRHWPVNGRGPQNGAPHPSHWHGAILTWAPPPGFFPARLSSGEYPEQPSQDGFNPHGIAVDIG